MKLIIRRKAKKNKELTIVISAKIDECGRVKIMQDVNANYPNISLVREVRDRTELILSYLDRSIEEFINNRKNKEDNNETDKV